MFRTTPQPAPVEPTNNMSGLITFLIILWVIAGIAAFITSLVCMGKSGGTFSQNLGGLLFAIILGPFYFLYLAAFKKEGYCQSRYNPAMMPNRRGGARRVSVFTRAPYADGYY